MDQIQLIKSGKASVEELVEYAASNRLEAALAVAESVYTPGEILAISALDADAKVRLAVVRNPNVTVKTLNKLVCDHEKEVAQAAQIHLEEKYHEVVL